MCLYSKHGYYSVAMDDIKCYKILRSKKGMYETPYQNHIIPNDVISGINKLKSTDAENVIETEPCTRFRMGEDYNFSIYGGFVHSCVTVDDAKSLGNALVYEDFAYDGRKSRNYGCEYVVYECIIPKGTKYYEGFDGTKRRCFASKEILFLKKI